MEVAIMITNVNLSTKERLLIEDAKSHEEICIQKYNNYAQLACDEQLQKIFLNHAKKEQEHYDTLDQLLQGNVPNMNSGQSSQQNNNQVESSGGGSSYNLNVSDKDLCTDLLMTEKYQL